MQLDLAQASLPVYEVLSSATRLKMLEIIGNGEVSVGELAKELEISNAIVSRHIQKMEDVHLIRSERGTGKNKGKKIITLNVDDIHINFPKKIYLPFQKYTFDLQVGHFTNFSIQPTCGLATAQKIIGEVDKPKCFMEPERVNAELIWFSKGFVEYKIPNPFEEDDQPELIEISFEIASEFPSSNNAWPSDIDIFVNDRFIAKYTAPGNYSDIRGRYTPDWWDDKFSQYGLLKHLRISPTDTGIDGKTCSDISLSHLSLDQSEFISLRFEVSEESKNLGGLTLFGKGFGNYDQNILINLFYSQKEK